MRQYHQETVEWLWDEAKKCYIKYPDGTASAPFCVECELGDWEFIDSLEGNKKNPFIKF